MGGGWRIEFLLMTFASEKKNLLQLLENSQFLSNDCPTKENNFNFGKTHFEFHIIILLKKLK
jgi:hypothetical protein